jgi:hypothetical protein
MPPILTLRVNLFRAKTTGPTILLIMLRRARSKNSHLPESTKLKMLAKITSNNAADDVMRFRNDRV